MITNTTKPRVAYLLERVSGNEATVIASRDDVVLCLDNDTGEYITWKCGRRDDGRVVCWSGHYYDDDFVAAARDFEERP